MKYLIVCSILLSVLTEIVVSDDILCLSTDNEHCDPCSKNEVLVTVPDCIPERTCQKPIPWPTALICFKKIERCECDLKKGYIRDENTGSCVHIKQCEVCKKNEVYNENPSCLPEPTCQNPNPQQPWSSESCEEDCEPRCECEEGCIRDETSKKCIPIESCPAASCCENEVWEECASRCIPERTCRNQCPEPTSVICTLDCVRRCECDWENGYVRDDCTDECVRVEECQDTCCPGETLNECASACVPEPTCFYRYPDDTGVVCNKMCVVRYECDAELGYIRDPTTGKCTLECPEKCGPNQVLGCKPCCEEATCCDPNPGPCNKKCTDICIQECLCAKGYVRNTEDGTCIPEKYCPNYD